jgi:hypothetical protein
MHPIHDVDVLLLLALALASKRRPAELVEIIAAIELIQDPVPSELRLCEAFHRLSTHGLIRESEGGFTLTPEAQKIMVGLSRKGDPQARALGAGEKLAAYEPQVQHPAIQIAPKQMCAAILAQRATAKNTVKNLLMPKPKTAEANTPPPGQRRRKPLPTRRRKA